VYLLTLEIYYETISKTRTLKKGGPVFAYQGHQVFPGGLFLDLVLCLLPLALILSIKKSNCWPKIGKGGTIWGYLFVYFVLIFLPHTTYAFFEIKHTIFTSWESFAVFGGISLVGLSCTLICNMLVVNHYAKSNKEMFFYYLFLSLVCGFGAAVGLLDYSGVQNLVPFLFPQIAIDLFRNQTLVCLALGTSASIFSIGYVSHRFIIKPSFK